MSKEELYDRVLDDMVNGEIFDPYEMIKDLVLLLEPEAVEKFARMYEYEEMAR